MGVPKPAAPIAEPAPSLQGREEVKLMYDMMTAAFQTDSTRVFSYRLPVETMVKSLGLRLSAQDISHYSPGGANGGVQEARPCVQRTDGRTTG